MKKYNFGKSLLSFTLVLTLLLSNLQPIFAEDSSNVYQESEIAVEDASNISESTDENAQSDNKVISEVEDSKEEVTENESEELSSEEKDKEEESTKEVTEEVTENESEGLSSEEKEKEESTEEVPEIIKKEFKYSDDSVSVIATVDDLTKSGIPEDAKLVVKVLKKSSEEYKVAMQKVEESLDLQDGQSFQFIPCDVYFESNGSKIEPEDGTVAIKMSFKEKIFTEEKEKSVTEESVVHIKEDGVVEKLENAAKDKVSDVEFEVSSFSIMGPIMVLAENDTSNDVYWWYDEANTTLHLSNNASTSSYALVPDSFRTYDYQSWRSYQSNITKVVIDNEIKPINTTWWFYELSALTEIQNIGNLNTSYTTSMYAMFFKCSKLQSLNLEDKFDTLNVISMAGMFEGCTNLRSLDLGDKFNTSNVINMTSMFGGCTNLRSLDLGDKFDTSKVTDMKSMFYNCTNLRSLDLGNKFDTSQVTNMESMFYECNNLQSLDLGDKFDTSKVTNMGIMFDGCKLLQSLDLGDKFDTSKVISMRCMFLNCSELQSLDLGDKFDTSKVTNMSYMLSNCQSLLMLTLSSTTKLQSDCDLLAGTWTQQSTGNTVSTSDIISMYTNPTQKDTFIRDSVFWWYDEVNTTLHLSNNLITSSYALVPSSFSSSSQPWVSYKSNITKVVIDNEIKPASTAYWFYGLSALTEIQNIENLNTAYITSMNSMLTYCQSLSMLTLSSTTKLQSNCGLPAGTWTQQSTGNTVSTSDIISMYTNPTQKDTFIRDSVFWWYDEVNTTLHLSNNASTSSYALVPSSFIDSSQPWKSYQSKITKVVIDNEIKSISTANWFYELSALSEIQNIENLNTSYITSMSSMFDGCSKLQLLDLGDKFVTSNVTDMSSMFSDCSKLQLLDLEGKFDTSKVTNMNQMFYNCSNLQSLNLGDKFDTSKVTDMYGMFKDCSKLQSLDLGDNFDTSNVTSMYSMFNGCSSLSMLTLSSTTKLQSNCGLPTGTWTQQSTGNKISTSDILSMYANPTQKDTFTRDLVFLWYDEANTTLHLSNNVSTSSYALVPDSFNSAFSQPWYSYRSEITKVVIDNEIKPTSTDYWFFGFTSLTEIQNINNLNTSDTTSMRTMFTYCGNLRSLDLGNKFDTSNVIYMYDMFSGCSNLQSLDLGDKFDTSKVTNMSEMFCNCSNLQSLNLGDKFDTSNVTNMGKMFYYCSGLQSLDLGNKFDTSKVTSMDEMFYHCSKLQSLDLGDKFDTSNVTNMSSMFYCCSGLQSLDLGDKFDTSKVTSMGYMFDDCSELQSLDLGGKFDTSKVTGMYSMFCDCTKLQSLDLGDKFDTSKVTNMDYMFSNCQSLSILTLSSTTKLKSGCKLPTGNWIQRSTGNTVSASDIISMYANPTQKDTFIKILSVKFNTGNLLTTYSKVIVAGDLFEDTTIPKKSGYTFDGWYTKQDGEGIKLEIGDPVYATEYFAKWLPNKYTITLNPNMEETTQEDVSISMTYDKTYTLSEDIFEREWYILSSWNTRRNGSGTSYDVHDTVINIASEKNEEVILYAQWKPLSDYAVITFDSDGGNTIEQKRVEKGSQIGLIETPKKDGYTFINWHIGAVNGTVISKTTTFSEDTTLVAEWKKNPIITFVSGIGENEQRVVSYNGKVGTLPQYPVNSNRYQTLIGWFTEQNGGTQISSSTTVTADTTYYAHWGWTPKWNTNGGKITSDTVYPIQEDSNYVLTELPVVEREGYAFTGWYLADGVTPVNAGDTVNLADGVEITAHWEKSNTYKVTLDVNGGAYSYNTEMAFEQGKDKVLTGLYQPIRDNCNFLGWATEDGTYYKNGDLLTSDLALIAQWSTKDCTVTFNPGTGTMYTGSKTTKVPQGGTLNIIPGTRLANYVFDGWYTEENGQGEKLTLETPVTEDITYYAYYVPMMESGTSDTAAYTFGAEWSNASNTDVDNVDGNLNWHPTANSASSTVTSTLHVRFELNDSVGDTVLPKESVKIRIPKYIWKDWDGKNTGSNNLSANLPLYPAVKNGMYFSYMEDGNDYILVNNQELHGGTGVDVTISYSVNPYNVPGGAMDLDRNYIEGYNEFHGNVPVNVTVDSNADGTVDTTINKDLSVEMHTYVKPSASMSVDNVSYVWNSSWGTEPLDSNEYFYIIWNLTKSYDSRNQPYTQNWTMDTEHDGTVVKLNSSSVVMKYPVSWLKDIPESGLKINNQAILNTDWKSGYEMKQAVGAYTTIYDSEYPRGEFGKNHGSSSPITLGGGLDDILFDSKEVTMRWYLTYDGSSRNSGVTWDENKGTYHADSRTIELVDGIPGDVMYSSGTPSAKYVWEPTTGNVVLTDNDYYISYVDISLTEYDSKKEEDMWVPRITHSNTEDYENVDLYIRYKNTDDFVFYKSVKATSSSSSITLPNDVVGYKVLHNTDFYSTKLNVSGTFSLKPTQHVKLLLSKDLNANSTSIIKDKSTCKIWNSDDETQTAFFDATNYTGGNNPAYKEIYELTKSTTYQYTSKSSSKVDNVIFDAAKGTQDNPMYIAGWNYNTSSSRKSPMTSGVFYDLLPVGTTVDTSTLFGKPVTGNSSSAASSASSYSSNRNSSNKLSSALYDVQFVENWQDSDRTMMIITWSAPENMTVTGMQFWYLLHNTYENVVKYGTSLENDVAFINTSEVKATPTNKYNAQNTVTEKQYYDDLQENNADFITYAKANTNYIPVDAFSWGFDKSVSNQNGDYGTESKVLPKGEYTYKLTYNQSDIAKSGNIQFYDILEYGADITNEANENEFVTSEWHGTLKEVNVSDISKMLTQDSTTVYCNPVVYYSTKARDTFTGSDYDVHNADTWTSIKPTDLSKVTAVAVDCSKNTDGTDFVLNGRQSLSMYVTMQAPEGEQYDGKTAYNQGYIYSKKNTDEQQTSLNSSSKVTFEEPKPEIHKSSEPETGTAEEPREVFKDTSLDYTLSVTNTNEDLMISDVVFEDTIPDGLLIDGSQISVKFAENEEWVLLKNSPRITMDRTTQHLTFTVKSLNVGETVYVKVPTVVVADEDTLLENTSKITSVNGLNKEISSETTYHKFKEYKQFNITIRKTDMDNQLLGDAVLQITGRGVYDNADIEPITWTSEEGVEKVITLTPGDYTLTEMSSPDGYCIAEPIQFSVTKDETINMVDVTETTLTINKVWNLEEGSTEPNAVTFELYRDGEYVKDFTVTKANDWTTTIIKLPKVSKDDYSHEYVYTIKEKDSDFAATYDTSKDGKTITVTNTTPVIIKGQKNWNDNNDADRPSEIEVRLLRDGIETATTKATADNEWKYQFGPQPKFDSDGREYSYIVKEAYLSGYSVGYEELNAEGIAITVDYQTESTTWDWFYIYYYKDGQLYRSSKYGGTTRQNNIVINIPSTEFWLEFRSDSSTCGYYGVKVKDAKVLTKAPSILGSTVSSMPSGYTTVEVNSATEIETPHYNAVTNPDGYGNNVQKRWHYVMSGGASMNIINTKLPEEHSTVQIAKVDGDGNPLANASLQLLDDKDTVVKEWVSETTPEIFEGLEPGTYKIHELLAPDGFETAKDKEITITDATEVQTFTFENKKIVLNSTLAVSKTVAGTMGSKVQDFSFKLALGDTAITSVAYVKGTESGTINVNADGVFEFTLAHGQTITFSSLPIGTAYTVTETNGASEGYTVTTTNATGTIVADGSTASFVNTRNAVVPTASHTNTKGILIISMFIVVFLAMLRYKKKYNL